MHIPAAQLGLIVEDLEPFATEVVKRRLGQKLFGVELDKVFGLANGGRNQRLEDRVYDVQNLEDVENYFKTYLVWG